MDRQEWNPLIINSPCIVNLANRLSQIIAAMGRVKTTCELEPTSSTKSVLPQNQRILQSCYAVVLDANQVIGAITAQEIVSWLSMQNLSEDSQLSSVFTGSVLPLHESDLTAQIPLIHLLQQRKAFCLPIVDDQKQLLGLLTTESIARFSQPLAPLRLQTVTDVMQRDPITVGADCSIWAIAQLITEQNSSVLVLLEKNNSIANSGLWQSWGIIQAQDIVQLLALGVDLNQVKAATIMQPIATISPEETLWSAYQHIDRQGGYPLAVTSPQGHLVGLLSLDNLLQAFDPLALYQLSEAWAAKLDSSEPTVPTIQPVRANHPPVPQTSPISKSAIYNSFAAASPVGILHTDAKGICTYVNDRYCEILGLDRTALIGQPWSVGYRPEDLGPIVAEYENARREHRPWSIEYRVQRPDGSEVWVYGQAAVEYNTEGQEIGFVGTITDISDRKHTEFLLESQHKVLERIARAEPLSDILKALLQTTEFHLPGTLCSILLCEAGHLHCIAAPSLPSDYCNAVDGAPIGEGIGSCGTAAFRRDVVIVSNIETDLLWKDYKDLALAYDLRACWSAPILSSEGIVLGVFGIYYREQQVPLSQDLKRLRQSANIAGIAIERSQATQTLHQLNQELERRVAERTADLQASEERWQLALKGANDGTWDWNPQTDQLFVSQRLQEIRGYDDDELPSSLEDWLQLVHRDDRDRIGQAIADHLAGNTEFFEFEYRVQHRDGSYVWILSRAQAQWDASGQAIRMIGSESDITQRKQAELALQENEKLYTTLAEAAPVAICRFDAPLNCVYVSDRWSEMTGRPLESALGQGWIEAIHPEDRERLLAPWNNLSTQPDLVPSIAIQGIEGRHLRPDGSINWVYIQARPEFNAQGQICGCISTLTDITQLKRIEAELATSEAKFRQLVEGGQDLVWAIDAQDRFTYLSPQFQKIFGWEPREWIGKRSLDAVYPGDRDWLIAQRALPSVNSAKSYLEFRHRHRDLPYIWVRVSTTPIFDTAGQWVGCQGILADITDRKVAELALQESERRYASLAAAAPVAIFRFDPHHNCTYVNERWSEMTGRSAESAMGQGWLQALHPEDREAFRTKSSELLECLSPDPQFLQIAEGRHLRPDGTINWFYSRVVQEIDEAGKLIGYVGTLTDISDRKIAELALQESERRYASLAAAAPVAIFRFDPHHNCTYVNERWSEMTGRSAESALGQGWLQALHPEDRDSALKAWERMLERQTVDPQALKILEGRHLRPDGTIHWFYSQVVSEFNEAGSLVGYVGTLIDITDRKLIEAALAESETKYRRLVEGGQDLTWSIDAEERFTYLSPQFKALFGWEPSEWIGRPAIEAIYAEDRQWLLEQQSIRQVSADIGYVEFRHRHRDLPYVWVRASVTAVCNSEGQIVGFQGTLVDITNLKNAELALQESETKFRTLISNLDGAVYRCQVHAPWTMEFISDAIYQLSGYPASDFIGDRERTYASIIHPDDLELVGQPLDQGNWTGQPFSVEYRILHQDGSVRWVTEKGKAIFDQHHNIKYLEGVIFDISDRKQYEQQLQEVSERLELAIQSAQIGIWEYDFVSGRLTWDTRMFDIYGVQPENFNGTHQDWENCVHPDDLAQASADLTDDESHFTKEFRVVRPNGAIRHILSSALVERDEQDQCIRCVGVNLDITERKRAEQQLAELSARLELATQSAHLGIWEWDAQRDLFTFNDQMFTIYGLNPETFGGTCQDWIELVHPEDLSKARFALTPEQNLYTQEFRIIRPDGQIRHLFATSLTQRNDRGELVRLIGTNLDISDRKQAEAQLHQSNEELLRATRLKDEFLANMSHELRTPLNAILGMSEALQNPIFGSLNERQMRMIQTVERSGEHLLELINDILDVAKIESGQITLEYIPVDIALLCQSSLVFVQQQAFKKRVQLDIQLPTSTLPDLYLDDRRIRQVLINLLNNAVKFTQEGGHVTLNVVAPWELQEVNEALSSAHPMLQLSVTDTGIGIAPEDIPKLFQPFVQIDSALNRQYAGTGLGLALVKRIVELHGGEIHLKSELGVGSCFMISLPYRPLETVDAVGPTSTIDDTNLSANVAEDSKIKILLAEDNEDNITMIVDYLEAMGYSIFVAHNGQEAIELTQTLQPDLVLMDIQMPGMDGLEAIRSIRQNPKFSDIPIIALTALAMPGDEARCLESGATSYLSKPVRLKNLNAKIQSYLPSH